MSKSAYFRDKYKLYIIYAIFMILLGIWQVLDWYFGFEDPIWHVIFYLAFMPFISFIFGILIGNTSKGWLFPMDALVITFFVFVLFANGGLKISMNINDLLGYGFLYIICPSFGASIIGVVIVRIATLLGRLFKHKK